MRMRSTTAGAREPVARVRAELDVGGVGMLAQHLSAKQLDREAEDDRRGEHQRDAGRLHRRLPEQQEQEEHERDAVGDLPARDERRELVRVDVAIRPSPASQPAKSTIAPRPRSVQPPSASGCVRMFHAS